VGFYEKFGFKVVSDEFTEEGVLHVKMELEL
jgi:ElaA protein